MLRRSFFVGGPQYDDDGLDANVDLDRSRGCSGNAVSLRCGSLGAQYDGRNTSVGDVRGEHDRVSVDWYSGGLDRETSAGVTDVAPGDHRGIPGRVHHLLELCTGRLRAHSHTR